MRKHLTTKNKFQNHVQVGIILKQSQSCDILVYEFIPLPSMPLKRLHGRLLVNSQNTEKLCWPLNMNTLERTIAQVKFSSFPQHIAFWEGYK